jgi:hypothetical protein
VRKQVVQSGANPASSISQLSLVFRKDSVDLLDRGNLLTFRIEERWYGAEYALLLLEIDRQIKSNYICN